MAAAYTLTSAVAQGMLNGTGYNEALGATPKLIIYSGTMPTNADTALSGNTVLATLPCAATPISGYSDTGTAARATFAAIAAAVAAASGTATFWRRTTNAGTVIDQGAAGTTGTEMILNTTSITAGSNVTVSSMTVDLPKGP